MTLLRLILFRILTTAITLFGVAVIVFVVIRVVPGNRSEEHKAEFQSLNNLVCRLLLVKRYKDVMY